MTLFESMCPLLFFWPATYVRESACYLQPHRTVCTTFAALHTWNVCTCYRVQIFENGLLDIFVFVFVQYLILANGARGRAAVALVQQAISNPHLFHFGELIDHENISALDGAPVLSVLCCSHKSQKEPGANPPRSQPQPC